MCYAAVMRHRGGVESSEPTPLEPTAAAAASTGGDLLFIAGEGHLSTHELGVAPLVIGRGDGCDVVIDHPSMSRRHAELQPGRPTTVRDLGSTNGTLIAGALRRGGEPFALAPGDGFRIGPFAFMLVGRAQRDLSASLTGRDLLRVIDPTPRGVPGLVRDFAASGVSILVLGETGVGKEVLASTVHELSGRRGALTRINCAALGESLLENELFGHEKGAFTGATGSKVGLIEAADGGTVFLDEIGEMSLPIQAKLLRVFEHREIVRLGSTRPIPIDVRFIAATNRDLPTDVLTGVFRRDLFFRLDGVTLVIPPLRERRALIGPLALDFLRSASTGHLASTRLAADVLAALEAYLWPGNVRELKAVMERAVVLARGGDVAVKHLTFTRSGERRRSSATTVSFPTGGAPIGPAGAVPPVQSSPTPADPAPPLLDDAQRADRDRIRQALEDCAGNQTRAAKKLGMSRTAFVTKLRIYRIPRPRT